MCFPSLPPTLPSVMLGRVVQGSVGSDSYAYLKFHIDPFFFRSKVDQIHEIVTGNPTVIKMVVSFNRGARGQNALRQILAPVVKEIIDDKSLNIKTDPVDIYKSWVNQMESQTGEARYETC